MVARLPLLARRPTPELQIPIADAYFAPPKHLSTFVIDCDLLIMSDLTEEEKKWVDNELVAAVKAKGPETPWRCAMDPKTKKSYFFNKTTKETTWQMPDELKAIELLLVEQALKKRVVVSSETTSSNLVSSSEVESQKTSDNQSKALTFKINNTKKPEPALLIPQQKTTVAEERQAVVDEEPVEGEEEKLLELLSRKDSILESDTIKIAQRLIKVYKQSPKMIIDKLAGTYSGYPQMCKILLDILGFAQSLEGRAQSNYEQPEKVALDHFVDIAKQRFNKKQADEILLRYTHTPSWLKDMIHNEDTRELLSELNMKHRDSKFLRLCTKEMNALGYGNKHSPLLIASELDHVHKFYSMFIHLTHKVIRILKLLLNYITSI
ncbi:hypothetical protein EON65_02785 [archaeon]|nr:MAG: hypothetical protein EON65_02785 [archaeon]